MTIDNTITLISLVVAIAEVINSAKKKEFKIWSVLIIAGAVAVGILSFINNTKKKAADDKIEARDSANTKKIDRMVFILDSVGYKVDNKGAVTYSSNQVAGRDIINDAALLIQGSSDFEISNISKINSTLYFDKDEGKVNEDQLILTIKRVSQENNIISKSVILVFSYNDSAKRYYNELKAILSKNGYSVIANGRSSDPQLEKYGLVIAPYNNKIAIGVGKLNLSEMK